MQNVVQPSTPFMMFPKWLLLVPCSGDAKILYMVISSFGNTSGIRRPSIKKLAELCGCSRDSIERRLNTLEKHGLIVRVHRRSKQDGKLPNEYILQEPEDIEELGSLVGDTMTAAEKKREFKNIKLGRKPKPRKNKNKSRYKEAVELRLVKGRKADSVLSKFMNPPA